MATRKKTETVETADKKPIVKKLPEGWTYSTTYIVCPNCGFESRKSTIIELKRCPLCGRKAEV